MSSILSSLATYSTTVLAGGAPAALPAQGARQNATPYQLFPAQSAPSATQQRYIHNPNAAGSIWVAFNGVNPVANGEGSFEIAPGGRWADAINSEVRVLFTAATMAITAYER